MNRRVVIILHLAVWAFLFLSPLTFINHGEGVGLLQYLMTCVSPLMMLVVFYTNYLWLIPRLTRARQLGDSETRRREQQRFWTVNVIMAVVIGIALHYWMTYTHSLFAPPHKPSYHQRPLPVVHTVFFILHDIFNLAVAAIVALAARLLIQWEQHEKARREAETARAEAELRNLRSQINPHFLLNTLNNIYALTAIDAARAQDAIQQLSRLLRHLLYDDQQQLVDLDNDVRFLENYINLMRIRLSDNVEVTFSYEPPSVPVKVAPLLGISLVENAFKHGISPTQPSFIHIRIKADEQQTVCDIENSYHPKTGGDRSGHGIGLDQVQRRLDLAYPGRYLWTYGVSEDGKAYRSTIIINN